MYGNDDDVIVGGVTGDDPRNWVTGKVEPDTPTTTRTLNATLYGC